MESNFTVLFLLEFNALDNSDKHLKPLISSYILLIQDLSRYFVVGLMRVSKDLILLKILSI